MTIYLHFSGPTVTLPLQNPGICPPIQQQRSHRSHHSTWSSTIHYHSHPMSPGIHNYRPHQSRRKPPSRPHRPLLFHPLPASISDPFVHHGHQRHLLTPPPLQCSLHSPAPHPRAFKTVVTQVRRGKESACRCSRGKRHWLEPWVAKSPRRRKWQPAPVFWRKIPWTEEPGGLQSMGSPRIGHNRATERARARARTHTHTHIHTHRKYNSSYFLFLDSLPALVEFLRLRLHMPMLNSGFPANICQYSTWRSAELCPSLNDLNLMQYGGAHVVTQACGRPY